jgi:hypothetical protein
MNTLLEAVTCSRSLARFFRGEQRVTDLEVEATVRLHHSAATGTDLATSTSVSEKVGA